jgi:ribosomal-protein-alanine N-acetyltransferase
MAQMAEARDLHPVRVSIRQPQPSDIRSLDRAERVCFIDPWPSQFFVSELFAPGRFHRVMVDPAGHLVAYLFSAWQYLDLHVLKVATLPPHRRTGLAGRLMELAEEHVRESCGESITLEVRTHNTPAIAMYASLGYRRAGIRQRYYVDGEDALIMTKRIEATVESPKLKR